MIVISCYGHSDPFLTHCSWGVVPLQLRDLHAFFGFTIALDFMIALLFTQILVESYCLHWCGRSAWSGWPWLRARIPWWTVEPVIPPALADVHALHNPGPCCQSEAPAQLEMPHDVDMARELLPVDDHPETEQPKTYPPIDFRFSAQVVSAVVFALVITVYTNANLYYTKTPIVSFLPTLAASFHNLSLVNTTTTPLVFPADILYPYAGLLSVAAGEFALSADAAFLTAAIMSALAVCFFQVRVLLNFRQDVTDGLERPHDPEVLAKLQFISINNAAYFFNYVSASAFMMSAQFFWTWLLLHSIVASSLYAKKTKTHSTRQHLSSLSQPRMRIMWYSLSMFPPPPPPPHSHTHRFHQLFLNWGFFSASLIAALPSMVLQGTLYALVLNDDNQIVYYRWYLWFEMWFFFVGLAACQALLIARFISTVAGFYFRWLRSDVPLVIGLDGPYLCYLSVVKIEILHTLDRCADAAAASRDSGSGKSSYAPPDSA